MSPILDTSEGIDELLASLEKGARIPARQRVSNISNTASSVSQRGYDEGFATPALKKLVDIITLPNYLDQSSLGTLIRNLYPASKVPNVIVIKVVGSLGHGRGKPWYTFQALLLKWLVMIYEVLEDANVLSQLYNVLFNLLDTIAIRPQLCHVLGLITRRKHVRPYRIQVLMELTRQAGNEPALIGLMRVYKDYFPDVIVADTSGKASVFTHPNQEWRDRLGQIQETYFQRTQDGLPPEKRAFRVARKSTMTARTRSSVLPEVHTLHAQQSSVTLEEIETVHDFVENLEKIQPPNQLVAVIRDPLLQKFLQLRSSKESSQRIDEWLLAFFEEQLTSRQSSESDILEMLRSILEYTRFTMVLPSACLTYLKAMLETWDGITGREVILGLLVYTPIGSFEDVYTSIFQPLEDAVIGDGTNLPSSRLAILDFYRSLLDQWTIFLLATLPIRVPTTTIVASLLTHTNTLALTIAQSPSINAHSAILTFYESTTRLLSHPSLLSHLKVTIPPSQIIYTLILTSSLSALSRLCSVLAIYKSVLKAHVDANPNVYKRAVITEFNGYIMDICNMIWKLRFLAQEANAHACLVPATIITSLTSYVSRTTKDKFITLPMLFSPPLSPTTSLQADKWLRSVEDEKENEIEKRHPGPVTVKSLGIWAREGGLKPGFKECQAEVMLYLRDRGVGGLWELMRGTIKVLEGYEIRKEKEGGDTVMG